MVFEPKDSKTLRGRGNMEGGKIKGGKKHTKLKTLLGSYIRYIYL